MKTSNAFPLLVCLFILLAAGSSVRAQVDDIRISPPDPFSIFLPDSVAMQSAASIGDRTLVVWGNISLNNDGIPVPGLMMQMVIGDAPAGAPVRIDDAAVPPATIAVVLALRDRFLVLWQNSGHSSREGFNARLVGLDGIPLGPSRPVPGVAPQSEAEVWVRQDGDGYVLSWHQWFANAGSMYWSRQHLDAGGNVTGTVEPLVGPYDDSYTYPELPGISIKVSYASFTLYDSSRGVPEQRQGEGTRLSGPHILHADRSLLALHAIGSDHRPGLHYYNDLFDASPAWSLPLQQREGDRLLEYGGMIRTLGGGRYEITYPLVDSAWRNGTGDTALRIMRAVLEPDRTLGAPVTIYAIRNQMHYGCPVNSIIRYRGGEGREHRKGADGTERSALQLTGIQSGTTPLICAVQLIFTPDGRVFDQEELDLLTTEGNIRNRADVQRLSHESLAQVRLAGRDLVLSAESIVSQGFPHQRHPALARSGKGFQIGWQELGTPQKVMVGELALVPNAAFRAIDSIIWLQPSRSSDPNSSYHARSGFILPVEHALLIDDREIEGGGNKYQTWTAYSQRIRYGVTQNRRQWVELDREKYVSFNYCYPVHDPNTGQTVVSDYNSSGDPRGFIEIHALDTDGTLVWEDSIPGTAHTRSIPIAPHEVYTYGDECTPLVRYKNGTEIGRVELSRLETFQMGRFRRLLGDRLLRVHASRGVEGLSVGDLFALNDKRLLAQIPVMKDSLVVFELYDTGGTLLAAATIKAPTRYYDFSILQARRDSSILIVWGSDNGIRLTVLGSNLQMRERDILISHTERKAVEPAIVLEDTVLHVVWADYRNPGADIYGTSWPLPAWLRSSPGKEGVGIAVGRALPTPSHDRAAIQFTAPVAGPLSVALVDALGRRVRLETREDIPAGDGTLELDLRGVAPGIYTVVLAGSDGAHGSGRIVVTK